MKRSIILLSLLVLALFVVSCAPKESAEEGALAGEAISSSTFKCSTVEQSVPTLMSQGYSSARNYCLINSLGKCIEKTVFAHIGPVNVSGIADNMVNVWSEFGCFTPLTPEDIAFSGELRFTCCK